MKNTEELDIEKVINEYGDMVYRLALTYGNTKENAEDIFQEVFLRLVRYQERLKSKEHVRNWLIRVTINCGKTYKMKLTKNQTLQLEEEIAVYSEHSQSEMEQKVYLAVKSLPEKYRSIIHL